LCCKFVRLRSDNHDNDNNHDDDHHHHTGRADVACDGCNEHDRFVDVDKFALLFSCAFVNRAFVYVVISCILFNLATAASTTTSADTTATSSLSNDKNATTSSLTVDSITPAPLTSSEQTTMMVVVDAIQQNLPVRDRTKNIVAE
jgi:hypothetical protein